MNRSKSLSPARQGAYVKLVAGVVLAAAGALTMSQVQAQPQPQPGMAGPQHAAMHRAGPGMHGGMPMIPERMLDAVGVSAEQKTKLREIFKAAGDDLRPMRENGRALHEQMGKLMAAPQVDAAAAEALRQKQLAAHAASSKRMLRAMLDAQAVLTPEQRSKLAERMAERRDHMEHRMERRQERHEHHMPAAPKG
jgi:Spy/CpxP family protein refolding chaperone